MGLSSIILAPVRVPIRLARALDDLTAVADRARREPDLVTQALARVDLLLAEIAGLTRVALDIRDGGRELTETAKQLDADVRLLMEVALALTRTAGELDGTGRRVVEGAGQLDQTGVTLDGHTLDLIEGGSELTETAERMEADLRVLRDAMPRILQALHTVDQLEEAVETVAETIEPLQGTAERVGRMTKRLSRRSTA
jgi:methyl-accepting chemotaxis protein